MKNIILQYAISCYIYKLSQKIYSICSCNRLAEHEYMWDIFNDSYSNLKLYLEKSIKWLRKTKKGIKNITVITLYRSWYF